MSHHIQELDRLRIPFDEIKLATNNFAHENFIGQGGFGPVYRGQLPSSTESSEPGTTVAVKRLDLKSKQGQHEFLMEIVLLASYKHENLVSLVGFSDEVHEKLLVYRHEARGSLDNYLGSTNLTWKQRLKICLGVAQGLNYLHEGVGTGHRVLHRDLKSSNILLDANWKAKIADFGLSKIGPSNQEFTFLVTLACGTMGYIDPAYISTGVLTKESDVYSFGIVLFEVLCGRLAFIIEYEDEGRLLSNLVERHYKMGTLRQIVMPSLLAQIDEQALKVFSDVAFQCLNKDRKQRPSMSFVVKCLQRCQTGTRTGLWGSPTTGTPFLLLLKNDQKLRKITIMAAMFIYNMKFTIEDSDGSLNSTKIGRGDYVGDSIGDTYEIDFDDDEEIIGISGTVGICKKFDNMLLILSLSFKTNKKEHSLPDGIGTKAESRFSASWGLGLFNGFYGTSGWIVDSFGCCLKN